MVPGRQVSITAGEPGEVGSQVCSVAKPVALDPPSLTGWSGGGACGTGAKRDAIVVDERLVDGASVDRTVVDGTSVVERVVVAVVDGTSVVAPVVVAAVDGAALVVVATVVCDARPAGRDVGAERCAVSSSLHEPARRITASNVTATTRATHQTVSRRFALARLAAWRESVHSLIC